jgi:nitrile hydratase accessory protein
MRQEAPNPSLRESLKDLPGIPMDAADSPVFNEPWEARAFAMTLALHERGVFTWPQWAAALSRQITQARAAGDADLGDTYYQHWLRALESLVHDLPP